MNDPITFEEHRDEVAVWTVVHKADDTHEVREADYDPDGLDALPEDDMTLFVHAFIDGSGHLALYCPLCATHIRAHICGDIEWVAHEHEHDHELAVVPNEGRDA